MRVINKTGGYGAGGHGTMKSNLKKGRTFYFDSETKKNVFEKQHGVQCEKDGNIWKYTQKD